MANALIYHCLSGQAFFSGVVLVQLSWLFAFFQRGRRLTVFRVVLTCTGLILIAVSATPLPAWWYLIAGAITVAWIGFDSAKKATYPRLKLWLRCATPVVLWMSIAIELPFHLVPKLPVMENPAVFIIGDSLSAGIGGQIETWPKLLARWNGIVVHDLSVAGADTTTALRQAEKVTGPASLVIAEIGGNDILRNNPLPTFERGLDALLTRLREGGHSTVMLELPLRPFDNGYGEAQRRLAKHHGVIMIPKRVLIGILTTDGATLDTIHLSARGQELMAQAIWGIIHRVFVRHDREPK
jgi:acyl-CoA thioesterase-1